MKLVVMSDSHGDKETVKAVSALPADAIFIVEIVNCHSMIRCCIQCIEYVVIVTVMHGFHRLY